MFKYIEENSDLSFGFARKALDNYWYPYGYRGITNFCEISVVCAIVRIKMIIIALDPNQRAY